jgi:hypothetical protein
MKMEYKPIMTLEENEKSYCAKINDVIITISKDEICIKDGIKLHPRMMAIETAKQESGINNYILFNK